MGKMVSTLELRNWLYDENQLDLDEKKMRQVLDAIGKAQDEEWEEIGRQSGER